MYTNFKIKPPFFEIGPKAYLYGDEMLKLARVIDRVAMKYDVDIIVTPQYTDIRLLAENTERILVFAQHMDYLHVGRGLGSVLPEAVKAAGAAGVMLNHAEKKLTLDVVEKTIRRADEVGLATIVCADTIEELTTLPGVGRKTANLIVGDVYGKPAVVADTHLIRLCNRLGFVATKNPESVEKEMKKLLPPEESNDFCHRCVLHGRAVCTARKAMCEECCMAEFCPKKI